MIQKAKIGNTYNVPIQEIYCDTAAEVLEIEKEKLPMGSTIYCIENKKVYIVNGQNKLVEM